MSIKKERIEGQKEGRQIKPVSMGPLAFQNSEIPVEAVILHCLGELTVDRVNISPPHPGR